VRLFRQASNGGPGGARNRALDEARGRWMAVFDSDDLMAPDRLETLVARAEADWCDIVVDNLTVFDDGDEGSWRPFLSGHGYARPRAITLVDYVGAGRMYSNRPDLGYLKPLICAQTLARTGVRYREDLRIGEDYDLIVRLLAQGAQMHFEPRALYRYRKHETSVSHVMRREHIEAMLAADADFAAAFPQADPDVRHAMDARRRSLEAALTYDGVITRLKAHDVSGGLRSSLRDPAVWPLLAMPVRARLKRWAARLQAA
jgi:succinoglycan biosynthesis protein ExoO